MKRKQYSHSLRIFILVALFSVLVACAQATELPRPTVDGQSGVIDTPVATTYPFSAPANMHTLYPYPAGIKPTVPIVTPCIPEPTATVMRQTVTSEPTPTESPPSTPFALEESAIPRLLSVTPDGLVLVDATGRERLTIPDIRQPLGEPMLVGSYAGSKYVVVLSSPESDTFGDWRLDIIDLSSFEILDTIEGGADKWINNDDDRHLEGDLLINDLALSRDGRYLYFHAGIETPVAEIYRYDMQTRSIIRLTDGDTHIRDIQLFEDRWIAYLRQAPVPGTDRSATGVCILDIKTNTLKLVRLNENERPKLAGWTTAGYLVTYSYPLSKEIEDVEAARVYVIDAITGDNFPLYEPGKFERFVNRYAGITKGDQLVIYDSIFKESSNNKFSFRILEYDFNAGLNNKRNEMVEIFHEDEIPIDYGSKIRDIEGNYYLGMRPNVVIVSPDGSKRIIENEFGVKFILSQSEEWLAFYNAYETNGRVGLRLYDAGSGAFLTDVTDEPVHAILEDPESNWLAYRTDTGAYSYHIESGQTFPLYKWDNPESLNDIEQFSLWLYR